MAQRNTSSPARMRVAVRGFRLYVSADRAPTRIRTNLTPPHRATQKGPHRKCWREHGAGHGIARRRLWRFAVSARTLPIIRPHTTTLENNTCVGLPSRHHNRFWTGLASRVPLVEFLMH